MIKLNKVSIKNKLLLILLVLVISIFGFYFFKTNLDNSSLTKEKVESDDVLTEDIKFQSNNVEEFPFSITTTSGTINSVGDVIYYENINSTPKVIESNLIFPNVALSNSKNRLAYTYSSPTPSSTATSGVVIYDLKNDTKDSITINNSSTNLPQWSLDDKYLSVSEGSNIFNTIHIYSVALKEKIITLENVLGNIIWANSEEIVYLKKHSTLDYKYLSNIYIMRISDGIERELTPASPLTTYGNSYDSNSVFTFFLDFNPIKNTLIYLKGERPTVNSTDFQITYWSIDLNTMKMQLLNDKPITIENQLSYFFPNRIIFDLQPHSLKNGWYIAIIEKENQTVESDGDNGFINKDNSNDIYIFNINDIANTLKNLDVHEKAFLANW